MLSTKLRRPAHVASAQSPTRSSLAPRALLAGSLALLIAACTPASNGGGTGGKSTGSGGSAGNSGSGTGGKSGDGTGGKSGDGTGGKSGDGTGGKSGDGTGGKSGTGGSAGSGGGSAGASGTGGGSAGSGGGGGAAGSAGSGGGSAGNTGTAGSGGGSAGNGGGSAPTGWYKTGDWGVTDPDWHGCVWTGVDNTVTGSDTSIKPQDFQAVASGGPYHVTGTVFNDYNAVALLGFNLGETASGDANQCKYNAAAASKDGPPGVAPPSGKAGLAVNWSQGSSTLIRIQIQAQDGATNADHRWCFNVTDAGGPSYAPFNKFNTKCWGKEGDTANPLGTYYDGTTKISAVVFLIAGDKTAKKPFDFTVNGFAPGNSAADGPKGG